MTSKRRMLPDEAIVGTWKVIAIEAMDDEDDEQERGAVSSSFITFDQDETEPWTGRMHFAGLDADIDWRAKTATGQARVDFTWEGHQDGKPCHGRCAGVLRSDGILRGTLFWHLGDQLQFAAKRDRGEKTS